MFGSVGYYHIPKQLRSKLDPPGHKCIFLGFTNTSYLVLSIPDLSYHEVRDVHVHEGVFLSKNDLNILGIGRNESTNTCVVSDTVSQQLAFSDTFLSNTSTQSQSQPGQNSDSLLNLLDDQSDAFLFPESEGDYNESSTQVDTSSENI